MPFVGCLGSLVASTLAWLIAVSGREFAGGAAAAFSCGGLAGVAGETIDCIANDCEADGCEANDCEA